MELQVRSHQAEGQNPIHMGSCPKSPKQVNEVSELLPLASQTGTKAALLWLGLASALPASLPLTRGSDCSASLLLSLQLSWVMISVPLANGARCCISPSDECLCAAAELASQLYIQS